MADNAWSQSGCNGLVWWYGIPGQGSYYWTARFGQYWVGGGIYQRYAANRWECGALGPPVKDYGYMSEFHAYGTWFQGGAIYFDGYQWATAFGDYGQTAGRLDDVEIAAPKGTKRPPEHDEMVTASAKVGPDITPDMEATDEKENTP